MVLSRKVIFAELVNADSDDEQEEFLDDMSYHMIGLDHYVRNLKSALVELDAILDAS